VGLRLQLSRLLRWAVHTEHSERPAGYHLIFDHQVPQDQAYLVALFNIDVGAFKVPAAPERNRLEFFALRIDGTRLMVQLSVAIILTAILYLALRRAPTTH
jgi:hypothetical protein